ncbi:sigma 54-interacting transcriptional regulator, partial [Acinetobacter baumannii]
MTPEGIIGRSAAVQQLRTTITRIAPANSRILITGPSGSGKELAARMIHQQSPRARAEFVPISAAGMTPERMDL